MGITVAWLLLVSSLPGQQSAARMRSWRALKASGAAIVRDGVYLLPAGVATAGTLHQQAREILEAGGKAFLIPFTTDDNGSLQETLVCLFDRSERYTEIAQALEALKTPPSGIEETEARKQLAALRREHEALAALDFFPGTERLQTAQAIEEAESALNTRYAPDEPCPQTGPIRSRDPAQYRGRTWATRARLWVDRVASAWLIQRFIDPKAKFLWLTKPGDCPPDALGFDYDGAEFTHVGARVSFEVLAASFGLDEDPALIRIGALVHYLDVAGVPVPEAAGFESILAGARTQYVDDDDLLRHIGAVLDSLYAAYSEPASRDARSTTPTRNERNA